MPRAMSGGLRASALGGSAFNPLSLTPHVWLDPSDLTTLFQTNDTSTPVTADGQTVGRIQDKSGNGFNLTQSTAGARPLYKTSGGLHWIEFDGADDVISVAYGSTVAQPLDRISGFRRLDAEDTVYFLAGAEAAYQLVTAAEVLRLYSGNTLLGPTTSGQGVDFVTTERHNGASSRLAIDNDAYSSGNAGADGNSTLAIANSGVNFGNIRFYGLVQFTRTLTDDEIAKLRRYMGKKQGRSL